LKKNYIVSRADPLKNEFKFAIDCKQAQVPTGSQLLALPLNASLLLLGLPACHKEAQASNEAWRVSRTAPLLRNYSTLLRFPLLDALPLGARFEKAIVYRIYGFECAANVPC
jgi:hypothetical protein